MATKTDTSQSVFVYVRDTNTNAIKRVAIPADVQVGLLGNPASLTLLGGLAISTADVAVDNSNNGIINVNNDDTLVAIDVVSAPTSGRVSVFLPPGPRDGQLHFIKDSTGTAGTYPIDIIPPSGTTIDGLSIQSLVDVYGSMAIFWFRGSWHVLVSGVGITNIGGASISASYITTDPESGLTNERHFTSSTNISITDNGPNSTFSTDLTDTTVTPGTYTSPTINVDQKGRITAAVSNVPPNPSASYITVVSESTLPNERVLSASTGVKLIDNGPNSSLSLSVNDNDVAMLSGSNFRGPIVANGGLSGSLQNLTNGRSYLVAGTNIVIVSASNGQITISSTASGSTSGSTGSSLTPVFNMPILVGTVTTNVAGIANKQSLGAIFFNPTLINRFSGSRRYFYRAIVDSSETAVSATVDLYDINGIITTLPGIITGSIMSSSQLTMTQLQSEVTSQLTGITGSGIFEARLWKTANTLTTTSSVTCRSARLEVEFS
jgi:hypothetical protein